MTKSWGIGSFVLRSIVECHEICTYIFHNAAKHSIQVPETLDTCTVWMLWVVCGLVSTECDYHCKHRVTTVNLDP